MAYFTFFNLNPYLHSLFEYLHHVNFSKMKARFHRLDLLARVLHDFIQLLHQLPRVLVHNALHRRENAMLKAMHQLLVVDELSCRRSMQLVGFHSLRIVQSRLVPLVA